jgi:hypothetical protein
MRNAIARNPRARKGLVLMKDFVMAMLLPFVYRIFSTSFKVYFTGCGAGNFHLPSRNDKAFFRLAILTSPSRLEPKSQTDEVVDL